MTDVILDPEVNTIASVPRSARPYQRKQYRDRHYKGGEEEWKKKLESSSTIYVGNLSCYTNEFQLYELFGRCGGIKRIIMGLDSIKKTPCGFCFVEFDDRESAMNSINFLKGVHIDGREIQVNIDAGFVDGRQFGRGVSGGQIGDERRRERESGEEPMGGAPGGPSGRGSFGGPPVLTRSITVMACIALISIILVCQQPELIEANILLRNQAYSNPRLYYANVVFNVRQAQINERREQFEKNFANFLVNLLKTSKPTLLSAFMKATLADKQLREQALAIFFNNTDTDTENDR